MTSRRDLDMPATAIAAALGVLVIAVALPFTIAAFPQTPKSYDASWGERALDTKTVTVAADTGAYRATVAARDFQPASIRVETTACSDSANPSLQQQPATLHAVLRRDGDGTLQEADFTCAEKDGKGTFTFVLGDHADIAGAQATDPATSKRIVWLDAAASNVTAASYTLEVTARRPASTVPPLPVPGSTPVAPTLAANVKVTLNGWDVAMNEHLKEVGK